MPSCAVFGCPNTGRKKVKMFRFPRNPEICRKWVVACKRMDIINVKSDRICSEHFEPDAYYKPLIQEMLNYSPKNSRKLHWNALPTINLPDEKTRNPEPKKRLRRAECHERKPILQVALPKEEPVGCSSEREALSVEPQVFSVCSSPENEVVSTTVDEQQLPEREMSPPDEYRAYPIKKIREMENELMELKKAFKKLEAEKAKSQEILNKFFTPEQLLKLQSGDS